MTLAERKVILPLLLLAIKLITSSANLQSQLISGAVNDRREENSTCN